MTAPEAKTGLAPKTVFGREEVRRIEALVDDSGVVGILDPLLPTDGRPRDLSLRTLLVGMGLVAASNGPLYVKRIPLVLRGLPAPTRRRLGVTWTDHRGTEKHLTLRQVERLHAHVSALVDGSEHYAGEELTEEERAVRNERAELVTTLIISASIPRDWVQNGHVAIDATFLDANSQPEHTVRRREITKAAKKAVQEGREKDLATLLESDHGLARLLGVPNWGEDPDADSVALKKLRKATRRAADPDAATIVYKGKLRHAYAAHLAVTIPSEADVAARLAHEDDLRAARAEDRDVRVLAPEPTPHLILGAKLTASTTSPAETAIELTRRMVNGLDPAAAGVDPDQVPAVATLPDGDTVIDRGYSDAKPEVFHHPMRALRRRLVFDLHKNHRGRTGHHRGAIVAFGNLYSPGVLNYPDLVSTDTPSPFAPWAEWQKYFAVAAMRKKFRLHTNGRPDDDGYLRLGCPARRPDRATVGCEVPGTVNLVITKNIPEVFEAPTRLPDVCTKAWLTVSPDVFARSMDLEWASKEWYDSFYRRRPRVEGKNGILKNPTFAALAHMNVRVRGRAKVGLFVAFAAAIANLRAVDRWRSQVATVRKLNAAIVAAKKSRSKRRSHTLNQLLAAKHRRRRAEPANAQAP